MSSPRSASTAAPQPALLVRQFDDFYSLLQGLAGRLRRGTSNAEAARHAIVEFFEAQENALRPLGAGFLNDIAAPARRVMAEMVDQLFVEDISGDGTTVGWTPLAPQLTGATSEAEVSKHVREDLQHLLQAKTLSTAQRALARVYLQALGLGFRRPFKETSSASSSKIDDFKNRLYALLYPKSSSAGTPQVLFPEAYAYTVSTGTRNLLPKARLWWYALVVAGVLLLIISWPVWRDATELVRAALSTVPVESTVPAPPAGAPDPSGGPP